MVAQNMLRMYEVKYVFPKKIGFGNSFELTKCIQQIEISDLLHLCAPCSDVPYTVRGLIQYSTTRFEDDANRPC